MCASMVHQDTTIYGDDAKSFRPERWLDAVPDARRAMERHFFAVSPVHFCQNKKTGTIDNRLGFALQFGKGTRACMGRDLAMLQMGKFVVEILRRFNLRWAETTTMKENEWTIKSFWLPEQKGLYVSFDNKYV